MRPFSTTTALASTVGGMVALLASHFIPRQHQVSFLRIEGIFLFSLPVFIGILLIARPKFLVKILEPFGVPHLDSDVEFRPKQPVLRVLWIASSIFTLSVQFVIAAVISPLVLVWRIALFTFKRDWDADDVPSSARLLLLLTPKRYREGLVGDLEEEFYTIVLPQYGIRKARWWYRGQVLCSLGPIAWGLAKRAAGLALIWKVLR